MVRSRSGSSMGGGRTGDQTARPASAVSASVRSWAASRTCLGADAFCLDASGLERGPTGAASTTDRVELGGVEPPAETSGARMSHKDRRGVAACILMATTNAMTDDR